MDRSGNRQKHALDSTQRNGKSVYRAPANFSGAKVNQDFDYSRPEYAIASDILSELTQIEGINNVDVRLIWRSEVQEISGYKIDLSTLTTIKIGDNRQGTSLIVGINQIPQ